MCHSCDSGNGIELNGESDHGGDDSDNANRINKGNDESNNGTNRNAHYYSHYFSWIHIDNFT